jgi:hypothetical protein
VDTDEALSLPFAAIPKRVGEQHSKGQNTRTWEKFKGIVNIWGRLICGFYATYCNKRAIED